MTQNIRMDAGSPDGSPDSWGLRAPVLSQMIDHVCPDVLCVQEMLFHQQQAILDGLGAGYTMIGYGRGGGSHDEYSAIFVNDRRFRIEEWDQFWLSDTPETIASATWGNICTRIAVWARLTDLHGGDGVIIANTHTDNYAPEARLKAAPLIGNRLLSAAGGDPVVLCGDFNAPAGRCAEFDAMTRPFALRDAWVVAERRDTPEYGTFVDYREPVAGGDRIDWILVSTGVVVDAMALQPFRVNGVWPSDHIPAIATIRATTSQ
ncbi:endonuclease/exonuclease/phosphatase family protein [Bifidobacterium mongoliense]|jgi:endonuclease/exonuclease/phosphatase family metal-dependent hydrolase|uniref:endonuclease/exonuclease/phosphatase family protein n=1 Tax=Bifidobacterium mongoliense TaxID=518643 RepID=UPI0030ECB2DE